MTEIVLDSLDLNTPLPIKADGSPHDIEVGELFGSLFPVTNPPSGTYYEVLDAACNLSTGSSPGVRHARLYIKQVASNPENAGRGDGEYLAMSLPSGPNQPNNNSVVTFTSTGSAPGPNIHAQYPPTLRHGREIHVDYVAQPGDSLTVRIGLRPLT